MADEPRTYVVLLKNGALHTFLADAPPTSDAAGLRLRRDGRIVAAFNQDEVIGWWEK